MDINFKIAQIINRKMAVSQGFYDGRFKSKVVPDKKKNIHKVLRKNKLSKNDFTI